MRPAAYAAKPSGRRLRVTPQACLRHDAPEGKNPYPAAMSSMARRRRTSTVACAVEAATPRLCMA